MSIPPEERRSPYQGLAPYLEQDAFFFFGRERERDLITANLMASRLTILYGISGVGKSSVLRAGAAHHLNRLADQNLAEFKRPLLAVAVFNGWSEWRHDPAQGLRRAVREAVTRARGGHALPESGDGLLTALEAAAEAVDGDVMLLLDQFEEYFLYRPNDDGPGSFADEFVSVVNATSLPVSVLVSIREDSVTQIRRFKGRIPHLLDATLHVDYLGVESARDAIVEPVAQYNKLHGTAVGVQPELVQAVLDDLAQGKEGRPRNGDGAVISTPYLQLVMTKLWDEERKAASDTLRVETLTRLGEGGAILRAHLDERMAMLAPREQSVAARMFHHLVTPSGAKVAHNVDDLAAYADVPAARLRPVLERLAEQDARILSASKPRTAQGSGKRYEIFHDLLAEPVLEWRSRFREATQRRRMRRALLAVAGVLLLVAGGAIAFGVRQSREAEQQERRAEATQQRNAALRAANPNLLGLLDAGERPLSRAEFSRDGRLALGTPRTGDPLIWSARTRQTLLALEGQGPVRTAAFDPRGSRVVTASVDGTTVIWDVPSGDSVATLRSDGAVNTASFDASGRRVVTASEDGTAGLWSVQGDLQRVLRHDGPVSSAAFNRPGTQVVTAGVDGSVRIWSVETGRELHRLDGDTPARRASFSDDGESVLTVAGGLARVWTPSTGRSVDLRGHRGRVLSAALTFDGRLAVTGGSDGIVRVWDARSGELLRRLVGHRGPVNRVVFGRRGRIVASASDDGTARIWMGRDEPTVLAGHQGPVNSISFDKRFTRAVTAGSDGTARLWRVPAEGVRRPEQIGRSVRGRPIRAVTVGNVLTGRSILVIGCMHGDECAGTAIVRRLASVDPTGTALVLVEDLNPDGSAARTRGNARGVDLNRNFPYRWTRTEPGREYSGRTVLSEPEARAAAQLIERIQPDVTIWYHQRSQPPHIRPPLVDESGGDVAIEQRYADFVGLPLVRRPRYPGSVSSWQNDHFPRDTAFVVELRFGGPLTAEEASLHVGAVRRLADELR